MSEDSTLFRAPVAQVENTEVQETTERGPGETILESSMPPHLFQEAGKKHQTPSRWVYRPTW